MSLTGQRPILRLRPNSSLDRPRLENLLVSRKAPRDRHSTGQVEVADEAAVTVSQQLVPSLGRSNVPAPGAHARRTVAVFRRLPSSPCCQLSATTTIESARHTCTTVTHHRFAHTLNFLFNRFCFENIVTRRRRIGRLAGVVFTRAAADEP